MKKLFVILMACLATNAMADKKIVFTDTWGKEVVLSKSEWEVVKRCYEWSLGSKGKFLFSIRKSNTNPASREAWLIFPDHTGFSGHMYRNGLDWRFDWDNPRNLNSYTVSIKSDGTGYYFDWALADEDGRMSVKPTAICK